MKFSNQTTDAIRIAVVLASYFLLIIEALFYPGVLANNINFNVRLIMPALPIFVFVSKLVKTNFMDNGPKLIRLMVNQFWSIHDLFAAITLSTAMIITGFEYFTYRNFVYSQIGLHFSYFSYLALLMLSVSLLNKSYDYYKNNWKKILFFSPAPLILIAFLIYLLDPDLFRWMVEEDSVVEWSQFFLLIISCTLSYLLAKYWWKRERLLGLIFGICTLTLFFVAGEEISWGQRLFGIQTPDSIKEINLQDEITVHNIGPVFGYVYIGYMIVGLAGSTSWIIKIVLWRWINSRAKKILEFIVPNWYYFWFFAIPFKKNFDRVYISQPVGEVLWEEPMELLLIMGITLFFIDRYYRVKGGSINKLT